jgi:epoxyqueuosine reductase
MNNYAIAEYIMSTILHGVHKENTITQYRDPLIGFASAKDPEFRNLQKNVHPSHKLPQDLLPAARSVVSFFLPFVERIVTANTRDKERVAEEWVVAYIETNTLIEKITSNLLRGLSERGVRAAAEPPTGNFDRETLVSPWSHKSVAVIAGLGSFGLHQWVITDSGCAGRFGSLVVDIDLPIRKSDPKERCMFYVDGSCLECVLRCPVGALDPLEGLDKYLCWEKCQSNAEKLKEMGSATVCGKCAVGVCAMASSR